MPKRSRNRPPADDPVEAAFEAVNELTGSEPPKKKRKNPHAVALGRKGGLKGGPARAAKLSKKQRSTSARKAAKARWKQERGE
ncbi:MAG TPA: hypothetical protein VGA22_03230 [Gemmatimonadales bacterium]|jgi:hypothetical protein